jgi:L-glyceraldehyde 3-phosphate reductase
MLNHWIEPALLDTAADEGIGLMIYSLLHQSMLTDRYLEGIPVDSRAAKAGTFLQEDPITPEYLATVRGLNEIANQREQTLAQMALAWCCAMKQRPRSWSVRAAQPRSRKMSPS